MRKIKLILLFMLFGIGILFLIPVKVFAQFTPVGNADDWYNYINQYEYGSASARVIDGDDEKFYIEIRREPGDAIYGEYYEYDAKIYNNPDLIYFEPRLRDVIRDWIYDGYYFDFAYCIERKLGETNYDGDLYWNFYEKYWQIDYFEITEENYYEERISYLEDLISDLERQLHSKNNLIQDLYQEIQVLNSQIQSLLDENEQLEGAYDAGYYAGYNKGRSDAIKESDGLIKVIPTALGAVWLVVSDFLSFTVLGINVWSILIIIAAFGLIILLIKILT